MTGVLLNDTSTRTHVGCRHAVANLVTLLNELGVTVVERVGVGSSAKAMRDAVRRAEGAAVIVNAEGSLHSGTPRARSLLRAIDDACDAGRRVVVANATIQRLRPRDYATLGRAVAVLVREPRTHALLKGQGVDARLTVDLSLLAEPVADPADPPSRHGLVVTDSVSLPTTAALHAVAGLVPNAERMTLRQPRPHLSRWALRPGVTRRRRLAASFVATPSPEAFYDRLRTARGLVAGRFHALCFALLARTPFVAVGSNTFKMEGLLEDLGLTDRLRRLDGPLDADRWEPPAFDAFERERIDAYLDRGRAAIRSAYADALTARL